MTGTVSRRRAAQFSSLFHQTPRLRGLQLPRPLGRARRPAPLGSVTPPQGVAGRKGLYGTLSGGGRVPIHSIFGRIRPSSALGNETTFGTRHRDFLSIRFGRRPAVSKSSVSEAGFGV